MRTGKAVQWLSVAGLCLGFLISYRLWLGFGTYPQVPAFSFVPVVPAYLSVTLFAVCVAALVWSLFAHTRVALVIALVTLALLCLFDLNALQPWVWQYGALLAVIAAVGSRSADDQSGLRALRWIVALTYLWSGVQKMNPGFFATMLSLSRHLPVTVSTDTVIVAAGCMAVIEFLIGAGLLWRRTRRVAAIGAIILHVLVLLALGPRGLNWNTVVWPWNLLLIVIVAVLFLRTAPMPVQVRTWQWHETVVLVVFGLLPAFSFPGWWDSYLSASLYSGNTDMATVHIPADTVALTDRLGLPSTEGNDVSLIAWSMEDLAVPAYPEERAYRRAFQSLCRAYSTDLTLTVHPRMTLMDLAPQMRTIRCTDL